MSWAPILIIAAVIVFFWFVKRSGQISKPAALAHLKNAALVIDVRTADEFNDGHLPSAINVPLDRLETILPSKVKDKNRVLLLHCASGARSGIAQRKLTVLGYPNVFNLGSYMRARQLVQNAAVR